MRVWPGWGPALRSVRLRWGVWRVCSGSIVANSDLWSGWAMELGTLRVKGDPMGHPDSEESEDEYYGETMLVPFGDEKTRTVDVVRSGFIWSANTASTGGLPAVCLCAVVSVGGRRA